MAWTATAFKARYTEFDGTADSVVTAALAEASRRTNVAGFGTRADDAVALLAAHLLSISPGGQQARREDDKGDPTTTYMASLKLLRRECFGGGWSIGQGPGGMIT